MPEKDKTTFKNILKKAATNSIMKRKTAGERVTIIIDRNDLISIKKLAEQKGLPYQTFTKSVLHQYIAGQFIDKNELKKLRYIK
jgi:predicted DNA binding CopG/RHH family protein